MKLRATLAGLGLLLAALTGCTVAVDEEPSATSTPVMTPSSDIHSIYTHLPEREGHQLDQTFLYEGPLSEIESFCLLSGPELSCTSDAAQISAALTLPDLPPESMAMFIGFPLFAVTDDGRLWGVRQPSNPALWPAIEDADWEPALE